MIYKSIAERLRIRLNSADFTLNSLLPGEKKLAEEFAVSRMTIRKAIDLLVAWGLVVRRHGSGTYLVRKDVLHQTASLTGLVEVLKRQGKTVTSQVLIFEIMPAPPAIASQLRIQINEQIYFSRRVRFVEGKPLMLEDSYMPVKLFRNLSLQHLEGSKFEYIEQECGILIGGNYESLTPVLADRLLARQMKVCRRRLHLQKEHGQCLGAHRPGGSLPAGLASRYVAACGYGEHARRAASRLPEVHRHPLFPWWTGL